MDGQIERTVVALEQALPGAEPEEVKRLITETLELIISLLPDLDIKGYSKEENDLLEDVLIGANRTLRAAMAFKDYSQALVALLAVNTVPRAVQLAIDPLLVDAGIKSPTERPAPKPLPTKPKFQRGEYTRIVWSRHKDYDPVEVMSLDAIILPSVARGTETDIRRSPIAEIMGIAITRGIVPITIENPVFKSAAEADMLDLFGARYSKRNVYLAIEDIYGVRLMDRAARRVLAPMEGREFTIDVLYRGIRQCPMIIKGPDDMLYVVAAGSGETITTNLRYTCPEGPRLPKAQPRPPAPKAEPPPVPSTVLPDVPQDDEEMEQIEQEAERAERQQLTKAEAKVPLPRGPFERIEWGEYGERKYWRVNPSHVIMKGPTDQEEDANLPGVFPESYTTDAVAITLEDPMEDETGAFKGMDIAGTTYTKILVYMIIEDIHGIQLVNKLQTRLLKAAVGQTFTLNIRRYETMQHRPLIIDTPGDVSYILAPRMD